MALSLRGTATGNAINGGNVTVTHPAGTAANDVMFLIYAFASSDNTNDNIAASTSGSTELADLYQDDNRECQLAAYRKVMPSTPDSTFVVTGGANAADAAGAVEHMWTGVDTTTPEDATTTTAGGINSSIPDPPSITTVTANAIVIAGGAGTFSSTRDSAVTQPTGYSNQLNDGANDTNAITVVMASKSVASPGAENPGAWTNWTTAITEAWNSVTIAVRPSSAKSIVAGAGSYSFTGTAATPKMGRKVAADAGSYAFNGTAATFRIGKIIAAGTGSYAFSGTAASLVHASKIAAAAGSYVLTGADATLRLGKTIAADSGSYAITGSPAGLVHAGKIAAGAGSYSLNGVSASPLHAWKISAEAGAYVLTGQDAALIHGAAGAFTLPADSGSYSISGAASGLVHSGVLAVDVGSYVISGGEANLVHGSAPQQQSGVSGGWLSQEQIEQFIRQQESRERESKRRRKRKRESDRALSEELGAIYDRIIAGPQPKADRVIEVVRPFAKTESVVPQAGHVDFEALLKSAEAISLLIERIREIQEDEEDEEFLLIAASQ